MTRSKRRPDLPSEAKWPFAPLRYLLISNDGGAWGTDPTSESDPIVLRSTEQKQDGGWKIIEPARRNLSINEYRKTKLKSGDILITKSSGSPDHIGKASLVDDEIEKMGASYSNFMQRIRVNKKIHPEFLSLMMNNQLVREQMAFLSNTTTGLANLSAELINQVYVPLPPPDEQKEILEYIGSRCGPIESLIERKMKFISLLGERITASVVEATKPRPEWKRQPFWAIARPKSISGQAEEGLLSVYLDRGVIPYSEGGGLVHKPAESLEKYQLVEPGDLVMNNQQAWRGSLGVSKHRGIVSPAYLIFELDREQIDPAFANYAFRSRPYVDQFMLASMSVGDIQRQIKWPHLRRVMVSLPSLVEQKRIVQDLSAGLSRLQGLIARTRMSVSYLQEKRTALITAAVTGKIDVRKAA